MVVKTKGMQTESARIIISLCRGFLFLMQSLIIVRNSKITPNYATIWEPFSFLFLFPVDHHQCSIAAARAEWDWYSSASMHRLLRSDRSARLTASALPCSALHIIHSGRRNVIMRHTRVKELMTAHPTLISPDATLQDAASTMQSVDCGVLPVGDKDQIEGMITDRDIIIRAIAKGKNPASAMVKDHMSRQVVACKESDTLQQAADVMHQHKVSRLIVRNDGGKVSGILSLGCILRKDANAAEIADVIEHARGGRAVA
jgi:CBS domain-containing protein